MNLNTLKERLLFRPGPIDFLINPIYITRRGLFKYFQKYSKELSGDLLDFGCGSKPYESLFSVDSYIGVDIEISGHNHSNSKIDIYYDGLTLPFPDNRFDSIFSAEVFEHLPNPRVILGELNRVTKENGTLLLSIPFMWPEHEMPYDYQRYTLNGVKVLLEEQGFDIIEINKSTKSCETLFQLLSMRVLSCTIYRKVFFKVLLFPIVIVINVVGIFLSRLECIFECDSEIYHNVVCLARKRG